MCGYFLSSVGHGGSRTCVTQDLEVILTPQIVRLTDWATPPLAYTTCNVLVSVLESESNIAHPWVSESVSESSRLSFGISIVIISEPSDVTLSWICLYAVEKAVNCSGFKTRHSSCMNSMHQIWIETIWYFALYDLKSICQIGAGLSDSARWFYAHQMKSVFVIVKYQILFFFSVLRVSP